jgi:hypothetical protein
MCLHSIQFSLFVPNTRKTHPSKSHNMDPQQLTPAISVDDSPSLSDSESSFGIPPEQVDIIRSIVDKWHKKPLQIASDIVSALVPISSSQHPKI